MTTNITKEKLLYQRLSAESRYTMKWKGGMRCNSCYYQWTSRRATPPARCPSCSSTNLAPELVKVFY